MCCIYSKEYKIARTICFVINSNSSKLFKKRFFIIYHNFYKLSYSAYLCAVLQRFLRILRNTRIHLLYDKLYFVCCCCCCYCSIYNDCSGKGAFLFFCCIFFLKQDIKLIFFFGFEYTIVLCG